VPTVTKITTQKKNTERFNVFWDKGDGEEFGFSVDQDVLIKYQITKGTILEEKDLCEILQHDAYKKGLNRAIQYLSYRMRSEKEVLTYLRKNEISVEVCEEILKKLKEYGYLNDLEFAKMFVRNRMEFSAKGPAVIKQELNQKGVGKLHINQALELYPFDLQVDKANTFAQKKLNTKRKESITQIKQKISQTLSGKGFPWEVIQVVMDSLEINQDTTEQWEALQFHADKAHRKYKKYDLQKYKFKMKQALYQKGFPIQLIDKWLDENEEENLLS
jgi:regulatory protein